jgi:hypothetical protein
MEITEDGPVDPEPLMNVSEIAKVLEELDRLGGELREAQRGAVPGPDDDEGVSVLLGLASRLYRLTHDLLERPSAWARRPPRCTFARSSTHASCPRG